MTATLAEKPTTDGLQYTRVKQKVTSRVVVAFCHNGQSVDWNWHHSLVNLLAYDGRNSRHVADIAGMRVGTDQLAHGRNEAARQFLETGVEWMLVVDTDAGFEPDLIDRMLAVADDKLRPVVGALAFTYELIVPDGMGGFRPRLWPTLFRKDEEGGYWPIFDYQLNTLNEVQATGSHCILIHRSVLEKVGPRPYDKLLAHDGERWLGEDISFCQRVREAGFPIYVHTGIKTSHAKPWWLCEEDYIKQQILASMAEQAAKREQS